MSVADITISKNGRWLTAVLRPVGELGGLAIERLSADIATLARRTHIVVVNLVETSIPAPAALARALRGPGSLLSGPDRCLLLVGADPALLRELRRCGGEVATLV